MSLISLVRNNQVHFTSSASRATGSQVGVLYFNFANTVGSSSGIQKLTNSKVSFEYSGFYEIGFTAYIGVSINQLTYVEYGLNGNFIILDEAIQTNTNHIFSSYNFIFEANAGDFLELRVRTSSGTGLFAAYMGAANLDTVLSTTMSIKKL